MLADRLLLLGVDFVVRHVSPNKPDINNLEISSLDNFSVGK